ncbi:endonuclease MutS2 [bacterium]|nr:endonuclease MutS2 [bacterium]
MDIVLKTLNTLEFNKIQEKVSSFAKSTQSKTLALNAKIYDNQTEIKKALNYTKEAKNLLDFALDIPIGFVANISEIQKNALISYLSEEELIDVAKTLRSSRLVKKFLNDNSEDKKIPQLVELAENLISARDLEERITNTFDDNLEIKKDATQELKGLWSSLYDNEKNLKNKVSDLLNSSEFSKHLQENIYTTRDDRIVFQVKAPSKNKVKGIVHDVSATNKTFYIEPECLVPINNKIREIKAQIHAEEVRILVELSALVKEKMTDLKITERTLAEIDFHFAKARYSAKIGAIEPEITDNKIVEFENMRHPLLIGTVENIVTNDFEIGKTYKSLVITGSNTGGKTVTIKTIGLFLLMARAGFFLPCTMAKLYPFKKVFADIGDDQSILQSLSTFSSHMKNIIEIVEKADNETYVLLDEICAGTDPQEGSVLAKVILEHITEKGAYSTITTHYGELKALEYSNQHFKNASVEFDTNSLKPTYKLLIGIPGLSNAIAISANLGLPNKITEKAKEILINQKDPSILVVEKLQETQQKLSDNLKETEAIKEETDEIKKEYEENLEAIKKDKKKTIKNIKTKFDYEMLSAKAEIKEILEEMRREKTEKIARRSYSRLAKLEKDYTDKLDKYDEKNQYAPVDFDKIEIGDKLLVKELHQTVTVLSKPDKKGKIFVQMGNIKTKMDKEKLAPYDKKYEKKQSGYSPISFQSFELKKTEISNRLDIRGKTVEDGLDALELFLDQASLAGFAEVSVIHGHGTGALKSAVRDFLKTSPYVKTFRAGGDGEGGDGISVIDLR